MNKMPAIVALEPPCEKPWGVARCVYHDNTIEIYNIKVRTGGFTSKHRHLHKINRFVVLSGCLTVSIWPADSAQKDALLSPGDTITIMPGVFHMFSATEAVEAIEIYSAVIDPYDIDRVSLGGCDGCF